MTYLTDPHLSFKARGLLAYLLSLEPDELVTSAETLATVGRDGRDAVLSGLRELEDRDYLEREAVREGGPVVGMRYYPRASRSG
jgi:hypothetical protein